MKNYQGCGKKHSKDIKIANQEVGSCNKLIFVTDENPIKSDPIFLTYKRTSNTKRPVVQCAKQNDVSNQQ